MPKVSILGSALAKEGSFEYESALYIGRRLAENGVDIVTGAYTGVMEAALKGAFELNVKKIGITTSFYSDKSKNPYVTEEIQTSNYVERLLKLLEIADAYLVLPGGTGTLAEFSIIWAFKSRGIIGEKPFVCLGEQWNEIAQTMAFYSDSVVDNLSFVKIVDSPDDAVDFILARFNEQKTD